jgi:hypothetical protein
VSQILLENGWKHGGTITMLIIELWLANTPLTSVWIVFPTMYSCFYLLFMWIYYAFSNHWVYDVLDFLDAGNLVYYIALPFLVLAAFWIMCASPTSELSAPNCMLKKCHGNLLTIREQQHMFCIPPRSMSLPFLSIMHAGNENIDNCKIGLCSYVITLIREAIAHRCGAKSRVQEGQYLGTDLAPYGEMQLGAAR